MTPLRRRMTEDLILHHRSPKTIRLSINRVADLAKYFHTSPERLGPEHVRSYLLHLVQERHVSWNVHKQARLALQSLYRVTPGRDRVVAEAAHPKVPKKLPAASWIITIREEVRTLLSLFIGKRRPVLYTTRGTPGAP
jgi:integrase/recombinase XerD